MKEFKGKKWTIQHTHYMGRAGSLSYGGGKTKEFFEWEKQQDLNTEPKEYDFEWEKEKVLDTEPKEYYYDEGVCELKVKDPIKVKEEPKIYPWTDFNYIHLGSNKSGYSGVNN